MNLETYSSSVEHNLTDAVLGFYGILRNNPEIKDFLEKQCWYPADPRPIDPALKKTAYGDKKMTQRNSIKVFEDRQVRSLWDDETEEWYFAVVVVLASDQQTVLKTITRGATVYEV